MPSRHGRDFFAEQGFHPMPLNERIEPRILTVFRLFIGVQWLLLSLPLLATISHFNALPNYMAIFLGWVQCAFLWVYLSWNWLRRALGTFYLPIALFIASVAPVVNHAAATALRLAQGLPSSVALVDPRLLYIWLLLPLLLIGMQYGYRALLCFSFGISALSILLAHQLDPEGGMNG